MAIRMRIHQIFSSSMGPKKINCMFPVTDFFERGWVGLIFLCFCYTLLGDAHVGYFYATKQNNHILNKQYCFSYCALTRMLFKTQKFSSVIY